MCNFALEIEAKPDRKKDPVFGGVFWLVSRGAVKRFKRLARLAW